MINSLFRRFIKILDFFCSSFFSRVPGLPHYLVAKLHLNHRKASPCVFNFTFLSFRLIILLLPEFFMEALHDGSSRIYFLLEAFIKILFRGAQVFFILHFKVQFFQPYHWSWYYVILDNLSSCFHVSQVIKYEIF